MFKPFRTAARKASSGFTLLEVLIAIVVVAFGLLGLAGLQLFALKNNQSASARVTATGLANDMIDRMKANFAGVALGSYNQPLPGAYTGPPVAACNQVIGCSPAQLATHDLNEWSQRVAQALPGGVGIVCVDSTPNDNAPLPPTLGPNTCDATGVAMYVIKIWWVDDRSTANPAGNLKYFFTAFNP